MTGFILQSCSNSTQTPNIKLLKYEHDNKTTFGCVLSCQKAQ